MLGLLTLSEKDRVKAGKGQGRAAFGVASVFVAVAWFVGGLAVEYIFYYPPFLFVGGLIAIGKRV